MPVPFKIIKNAGDATRSDLIPLYGKDAELYFSSAWYQKQIAQKKQMLRRLGLVTPLAERKLLHNWEEGIAS